MYKIGLGIFLIVVLPYVWITGVDIARALNTGVAIFRISKWRGPMRTPIVRETA